ncbi:AAA family ATPase [Tardisphaera miroshnichenkoae]
MQATAKEAPHILVKEVILEDFMSYEYARIPLKPGLNVITGPNGSGKSSILIGVSVALGQTYTERSKKLADLIRRGASAARVSIVFDNSPKNGRRPVPSGRADDYIVSRYIKADGTNWFEAEGREVSKLQLSSILGRFGINPNDSLIIMHQNMIENFSAFSPQEILTLFEDAVGIYPLRQSLLEAKKRLESIKGPTPEEIESGKQSLAYWAALHEKYQRKLELSKRLAQLDGELAWIRLEEEENAIKTQRQRLDLLQQQLSKLEGEREGLEKALAEIRGVQPNEAKFKDLLEKAISIAYEEGRRTELMRQVKESISEARSRLSKLETEAEGLKAQVSGYEKPAQLRDESDVIKEQQELKAVLATLNDVNEATEETYNKISNELSDLIEKAKLVEENRKSLMEEVSYREKLWMENLRKLVDAVGEGYKRVLASVGGAGYLKLVGYREGGDPNEAGLELYAGFRGTNPVRLDPLTHSGGERSVTIMAFLISLQQHVLSPIRAVDEFDVHMDPANKEAISKVLMEELSKKGDVEYIYITPGPLPPLPGNVHVLLVQKVEGKSSVMEAA